jgi:tRNA(adenine34) deaminase
MMFSENNYRFMHAALQEARKAYKSGEVPIGAVVVNQNIIIGKGFNQVESLKDATAHAEMIALTAASESVGNWRLNECDLYVTVEPCIMCAGAILLSRIKNLYFSALDPKFGACGSVFDLLETHKYNHKLSVYGDLLSAESKSLLKVFFDSIRNSR